MRAGAFVRAVSAASRLGGWLAMGLLAAAVAVICQMVFIRYVLNGSTVWQTEFVIYSVTAAIFLGSPQTLAEKGHVRIDLLSARAGPRGRLALEVVAALVSVLFLGTLAWSGWHYFYRAWSNNWLTETAWELPLWIPLLPLPAGMTLLCLQYGVEIGRTARAQGSAREGVEGAEGAEGES